jgi:hypothetical protein
MLHTVEKTPGLCNYMLLAGGSLLLLLLLLPKLCFMLCLLAGNHLTASTNTKAQQMCGR